MSRLRSTLAWLLPACGLVLSCGWIGLIEPTETRYAEIAREMLKSGDWLIPRLNGIPHFHKPPIAYWATASGMALLGANEWGARLGLALAAGFVLWCTARMARQHNNANVLSIGARIVAPELAEGARQLRHYMRRVRETWRVWLGFGTGLAQAAR